MSPNSKVPAGSFELDENDRQIPPYVDGDELDDLQGLLAEEERAVFSHNRLSATPSNIKKSLKQHGILQLLLSFLYNLRPATFDLVFGKRQPAKELRPSAYLDGLRGLGALSVYFFHTIGAHGSANEGYGQNEYVSC